MSQRLMFEIVKELGGVNVSMVKAEAIAAVRYPWLSPKYRSGRYLRELQRAKYLSWDQKSRTYTIIDWNFPEANIYTGPITEEDIVPE